MPVQFALRPSRNGPHWCMTPALIITRKAPKKVLQSFRVPEEISARMKTDVAAGTEASMSSILRAAVQQHYARLDAKEMTL